MTKKKKKKTPRNGAIATKPLPSSSRVSPVNANASSLHPTHGKNGGSSDHGQTGGGGGGGGGRGGGEGGKQGGGVRGGGGNGKGGGEEVGWDESFHQREAQADINAKFQDYVKGCERALGADIAIDKLSE